jgi:hypothetical protein
MKKSTLIATFLVNLRSGFEMEHAERIVAATFDEHHPNKDFHLWNGELNDAWCENVIRSEPSPSYVKVDKFILDLWDMH